MQICFTDPLSTMANLSRSVCMDMSLLSGWLKHVLHMEDDAQPTQKLHFTIAQFFLVSNFSYITYLSNTERIYGLLP